MGQIYFLCILSYLQGRGLFASKHFSKGDIIFEEAPLVNCQFAWNELYKYTACEFCLRSLETAEEMAQRLTNNTALVLPHPECCDVKKEDITLCPQCQVSELFEPRHGKICLWGFLPGPTQIGLYSHRG